MKKKIIPAVLAAAIICFVTAIAVDCVNYASKRYTIKTHIDHICADIGGLAARLSGKDEYKEVVRSENGRLFRKTDFEYSFSGKKEDERIERVTGILDHAQKKGIMTLYVQKPEKFDSDTDSFADGSMIEYRKRDEYWCRKMAENGFDVLDLKQEMNSIEFFKTDHHWTIPAAFTASGIIAEKINELSETDINADILESDSFEIWRAENPAIGEEGCKTGRLYAGTDVFEIPVPCFGTDLKYEHYEQGKCDLVKEGSFRDALIDGNHLEKEWYKYTACMYGKVCEYRIKNNNNNDGTKVMMVSSSMGRPVVMYLSLTCSEIRSIDPQHGRYNKDITEYIDEYDPDILIYMHSGRLWY